MEIKLIDTEGNEELIVTRDDSVWILSGDKTEYQLYDTIDGKVKLLEMLK